MTGSRDIGRRYLEDELASRRFFRAVPYGGPVSRKADISQAIETLLAIGGLSAEEARDWRARFDRAAMAPEPNPQLRTQARAHLDSLDVAEGDYSAARDAFAGIGLITPDEQQKWHNELLRQREAEMPPDPALERSWRAADFDDTVFVRVLAGPDRRVAGIRITAVEIYEGGVVVNWHFSAHGESDPAADAVWGHLSFDWEDDEDWDDHDNHQVPIALADDLGTDYVRSSGGFSMHGEESHVAFGHEGFAPGPPADPRYLDVVVAGTALRLDLPEPQAS